MTQQRSLFGSGASTPKAKEVTPLAPAPAVAPPPRVYSVSELNSEFKFLLESTYPSIWVEGEVSNFSQPTSGHFYFCLKDNQSSVRAVMWKSSHRGMKWRPKNGMKVMINGRVTLYEPKGEYQIEVVQMVPHGKGDLFEAFEQLKEKLKAEGLFDTKRKRPIPLLPKKIGIVTSPTGAAIRDILNILNRRYANLHILIFPAKVQGEEATPSIVEGIRALNRFRDIEVLILARGGGSIEDLWPFNEELVARAITASRIPVISAVGHETDTTIADFAADLRAPTPSAAAEMVIGKKSEFADRLVNLTKRIQGDIRTRLLFLKNHVHLLSQHKALAGVPQKIHTHQQTIDDREMRLRSGLGKYYQIQSRRQVAAEQHLHVGQLRHLVLSKHSRLVEQSGKLQNALILKINLGHKALGRTGGKLDSLSPLAVLERGYSIACLEDGTILKKSSQTFAGSRIQVRLHEGRLRCQVTEVDNE
jgi:exodeoxyribonuclease VII large subunit